MEIPWAVILFRCASKIRYGIAPDDWLIYTDITVFHLIVVVPLNDLDKIVGGADDDANMIGPSGAVAGEAGVLAAVVNDIPGQGLVAVILYPCAQLLKQLNLPLAAAFSGDDICDAALDCYGADEGGAPFVFIQHALCDDCSQPIDEGETNSREKR